jgi:hypothetical protein
MGIKSNIGPSMDKVVCLDEIHSMSFSLHQQSKELSPWEN